MSTTKRIRLSGGGITDKSWNPSTPTAWKSKLIVVIANAAQRQWTGKSRRSSEGDRRCSLAMGVLSKRPEHEPLRHLVAHADRRESSWQYVVIAQYKVYVNMPST